MKVIKRDGSEEDINIKKIQKQTIKACEGLNNVDPSELELDAQVQFYDGISSEQIQQTLIKTAYEKTDIDRPDWTFVAARLFINDLYKKVQSNYVCYNVLGRRFLYTFDKYIYRGVNEGWLDSSLTSKYSADDIDYLRKKICLQRDYLFNYLGIKTLYDKYLIKDKKGNPVEIPQYMFMAISMFLMKDENTFKRDKVVDLYNILSTFQAMLATPLLANARKPRHQLSSCYVLSLDDSIESIFESYKHMALLSKYGGGIGVDVTKIRSVGSSIDGNKGASGGAIPFLKIMNDICVGVDQLGTRKGAIAPYMEVWHKDIEDFLDLRKNSGEERRRAHEIFPAIWVSDLFMERVENDREWTLFDPYEAKGLTDCWGEEFENLYRKYEADSNISKVTIKAKNLWKKILTSLYETGMPFIGFKDEANRRNPLSKLGIIRSSNLCTEIFQNTSPLKYKYILRSGRERVELNEEDVVELCPMERVKAHKKRKKSKLNLKYISDGTTIDTREFLVYINNKKQNFLDECGNNTTIRVENKTYTGETAVCNLASINISKTNTKEDIMHVTNVLVTALDNAIDLNYYPTQQARETSLATRPIGIGIMGEAQLLAERRTVFGSHKHERTIKNIMSAVSYYTLEASLNLAVRNKGITEEFKKSCYAKGKLPFNPIRSEYVSKQEWEHLKDKIKISGLRNLYLLAIAPTSSISILCGTTQGVEPCYARKWFESNISGSIPVCVPNLNSNTFEYYTPAYEVKPLDIVKMAAIRQSYMDQGQSLNIFITPDIKASKLHEIYMSAWKLGLKSTYYLRSKSPDSSLVNDEIRCEGCQ